MLIVNDDDSTSVCAWVESFGFDHAGFRQEIELALWSHRRSSEAYTQPVVDSEHFFGHNGECIDESCHGRCDLGPLGDTRLSDWRSERSEPVPWCYR